MILDEIQYSPGILGYLKTDIDAHRDQPGRYVLAGSLAFPLMRGVSESLAGRIAVTSLLSMSLRETIGEPDLDATWQSLVQSPTGVNRSPSRSTIVEYILRGAIPSRP